MGSIELLVEEVKQVKDFRKARGQRYKLYNLLAIIILAVISGADDFVAIAAFCKGKKSFLIAHGLIDGKKYPSHDLFRYIFQYLDRESFAKLLAAWLQRAVEQTELGDEPVPMSSQKMIHVDGKSLRASREGKSHSRSALQIVTAYCSDTCVSIGQSIIDKKSCEKTAIPKLLNMLDLKDTIVTIDAVTTTKKNVALIVNKEADYLLALKKNNKHFCLEVASFFEHFSDTALIVDVFEQEEQAHGRTEKRTCRIISDLSYFSDAADWKNLKSLICIASQRTVNGKTSVEKRYYISSLLPHAKVLAQAIRRHWTVENELHWSLDVAFNEDRCRIKDKNAAANFAATRRFALALLKNAKISKLGIKNQRLQAAWDEEFLEQAFEFFQQIIILEK